MVNRVILAGNCARDTQSVTTSGAPMARMRLATTFSWRDSAGERQEATEFHSVVVFGRLAEVCAMYCQKGRRVYLEGRLRTREFTGSDGVRRWSTEVVGDMVKLLGGPGGQAGAETPPPSEAPAEEAPAPPTAAAPAARRSTAKGRAA